MHSVDVCVATFKRPKLLRKLLESLFRQSLDDIRMRVIVVDNDHDSTAQNIVEAFKKTLPFEVIYDVEPVQSIPLARNRALSYVRSDYIAIVDDDETVPENWLTTMLATMEQYKADVVCGPVVSLLPAAAPEWAKSQKSFQRVQRPTGTRLECCATNNVIIRRSSLGVPSIGFNPVYGLSGCDDTDFFYRLHLAGKRLIWCDDAEVTEHVPESRVTLKWLRRRGFRSGQSFVRVFVARYSTEKKVIWFIQKIMYLVGGIIGAPFALLLSYSLFVRLTVKIMAMLGQLSIVFGNTVYEEYRTDRYK